MEFCEGGSLDSIYREVKKLGGRTGEKVLGKIAEGVLNGLTYLHGKKDYPPRYQTQQHSLVQGWTGQTLRFWCQWRVRNEG
jgi:serine/threonine protein kinase